MRCAVLGGGGFIGSSFCQHLLQEGHRVRVFDRPGALRWHLADKNLPLEWCTGDLLRIEDAVRAVKGCDVALHLAWRTLPKDSEEDPVGDAQANLPLTWNVLEALRSQGVPRIVFISSGGTVYGPASLLPIDESHPTNPIVPYGITKLAAEKYLGMYQRLHGLRAIILRVSCPYGEMQRPERGQGVVATFLHRALAGNPLEVWGDGTHRRDFLHVADLADAFSRAIAYEGAETVFNIGSGTGTSVRELILLIEEVLDMKLACRYQEGRPFDVPVNILDCRKALRELGWTARTDLRSGLIRTARRVASRSLLPGGGLPAAAGISFAEAW